MPHRRIQSWYTGRRWVGCYISYSEEGPGRAAAPPSPLLAVPNVTAHPSTASVPVTVLPFDGPLLCGFNVAIKGLKYLTFLLTRQHKRAPAATVAAIVDATMAAYLRIAMVTALAGSLL